MKFWKALLLLSFLVYAVQSAPAVTEENPSDEIQVSDTDETPKREDETTNELEDAAEDENDDDDNNDEQSDEEESDENTEDEENDEENAVEESDEDARHKKRKFRVFYQRTRRSFRRCGKKFCRRVCPHYRRKGRKGHYFGRKYRFCPKRCYKICRNCTRTCRRRCYRYYYYFWKKNVKCGKWKCWTKCGRGFKVKA